VEDASAIKKSHLEVQSIKFVPNGSQSYFLFYYHFRLHFLVEDASAIKKSHLEVQSIKFVPNGSQSYFLFLTSFNL
jgi:hypothetical protein